MGKKIHNRRDVIFSFDYELYLGIKSGSVSKCVIEPVAEILKILQCHRANAIFFIDTTWLLKLKELSGRYQDARTDFDKVMSQMKEMATAGHYLFPHLHPHWLDARYLDAINQWQLADYSKYHFHSLDKEQRELLFSNSIALLNEIILPVQAGYSPCGYRAGGWSIEPFSDFEPFFRKYGIRFDFSKIENAAPYTFSKNMTRDNMGEFTEFPISSLNIKPLAGLWNRVLLKYLWIANDRGSGDGAGAVTGKNQSDKLQGKGEANRHNCEMAAIELLTRAKLSAYLNYLENNTYMQFIAHPKMLSCHNLKVFQSWMDTAFHKYEVETDFMKIPTNS